MIIMVYLVRLESHKIVMSLAKLSIDLEPFLHLLLRHHFPNVLNDEITAKLIGKRQKQYINTL